jgi:ferritin-like metal-binding protein YciE
LHGIMIETLEQLYVQQLRDLFSAQTMLCDALQVMAEAASHKDLRAAFQEHLEHSRQQRHRIDQILESIGEEPDDVVCRPMEGLIAAGNEMIRAASHETIRDAGLIAVAQRITHYEAAAYGTVVGFTHALKRKNDRRPMEDSLRESREASENLAKIATRTVDRAAAA